MLATGHGKAVRTAAGPAQPGPREPLGATRAEVLQRGPHFFIDENMRPAAGQDGRFSLMKEPADGCSLEQLHENAGKLRRNGCCKHSWSRRRRTCGLARRLWTAAVRTGEAGLQVRRALMHVATKT